MYQFILFDWKPAVRGVFFFLLLSLDSIAQAAWSLCTGHHCEFAFFSVQPVFFLDRKNKILTWIPSTGTKSTFYVHVLLLCLLQCNNDCTGVYFFLLPFLWCRPFKYISCKTAVTLFIISLIWYICCRARVSFRITLTICINGRFNLLPPTTPRNGPSSQHIECRFNVGNTVSLYL